jgi:MFS family permease
MNPLSESPNISNSASTALLTGRLSSRTFIGLLVAQFLAAFNDQAIHAAAMFFAINTQLLTEENAITLMPMLFYAPWALFGTLAGWLADRYSKRQALVFWKIAEVGICTVALAGFYFGRNGEPILGPILCLATVFLMGMHSAFFVPAKYGVMPEILPPHLLSKGNGLLESLSFLAVILGTVSGGVLSFLFQGQEYIVGIILLALALLGAAASALIRKMPAANPKKPFPKFLYGPLVANLKVLLGTPALRLALQGIAFFTFVVAFMRAAVYMLGECQNPRWDELKTSVVVGTVALGIGLGSPLAGYFSGRRIELRLVLAGATGMIALLIAAGLNIDHIPLLVACIVGIGFFTGFYIVPLFTLLQHKAPKADKGDMIATSNFVNVTGAIAATVLFKLVVMLAHASGLAPELNDGASKVVATGYLTDVELRHSRPVYFEISDATDTVVYFGGVKADDKPETLAGVIAHIFEAGGCTEPVKIDKRVNRKNPSFEVDVHKYDIASVSHFHVIPAGMRPEPHYDNRRLPGYLFLGAAVLTTLILLVIWRPIRKLRQSGL